MAYLPDDNCYWIATGEVLCPKQKKRVSFEQFANIAKLGESCDDATCERGSTCFTKEGETNEFCRKVLWQNETGCASQANHVCMQGLNCTNDVCIRGTQSTSTTVTVPTTTAPVTTAPTETAPTTTVPTVTAPVVVAPTSKETTVTAAITPVATNNFFKVILFIVVGILVILCIVAIIYMLTRTTSSSYNSSTYRSTF